MFLLSCSDLLLSVVRPVLFIFLGFFFSVALFVLFSCCCLVCTTYTVIMTWLFHLYTSYFCLVFAVSVLKFLPWLSFVAFLHCMYVYKGTVILRNQCASGLCMPFKTLRHIYKKGYFHILSHSLLIWLQSFKKNLQIIPSKKIVSKKFVISIKKCRLLC
jgi:hypothetical protein